MRNKSLLLIIIMPMIFLHAQEGGYLNKLTFRPGDTLKFYISTAVSNYQIDFYKYDQNGSPIFSSGNISGGLRTIPDSAYANGCNWPMSYQLLIPSNWQPAVYEADFPVNNGYGQLVFAVQPAVSGSYSDILVILPSNTWQAYNNFGGKSLYEFNSSNGVRSYKVSYNRPFTSGAQWDYYRWTDVFIHWIENLGINVEFANNVYVDKNPSLLGNYNIVIDVGHDEYWSYPERHQFTEFINNGGRLMILGGNTCWWQVRFEDNFRTVICYKDSTLDPLTGTADSLVTVNWYNNPVNNPENSLTGVSFRGGGYVNNGNHLPHSEGYGDYAAFNTFHWIFKGTGLKEGQEFGFNSEIVGYETDGAKFNWQDGIPTVTGEDETPLNFRILGLSPADNPEGFLNTHATMGLFYTPSGGAVFDVATTDWAEGLSSDDTVKKISENVLRKFIKGYFPPEITYWSPFVVEPKIINNEQDYVNLRDSLYLQGDSIRFSIGTTDPLNKPVNYFWTVNGVHCNGDTAFVYHNDSTTIMKVISAFAYNDKDTSSISWNLYTSNIITADLGDRVWIDQNKNGIQDSGEPGLGSVRVDLYKCDGTSMGSSFTDSNGHYEFNNINAGSYYLKFNLLDTLSHYRFTSEHSTNDTTLDSDVNPSTGLTECITLLPGQSDLTRDAGVYDALTNVSTDKKLPKDFELSQNYPNPFNPSTTIDFALPRSGYIKLEVYNIIGQQVAMLVNRELDAGYHKISFNAYNLPSGIYIYKMTGVGFKFTRKMVLLR